MHIISSMSQILIFSWDNQDRSSITLTCNHITNHVGWGENIKIWFHILKNKVAQPNYLGVLVPGDSFSLKIETNYIWKFVSSQNIETKISGSTPPILLKEPVFESSNDVVPWHRTGHFQNTVRLILTCSHNSMFS